MNKCCAAATSRPSENSHLSSIILFVVCCQMAPALTVPVSFQNTTTPVPIATIGHGLDPSTGWFPLTVGPTIVATDASSHSLEPAEDAGATIPSHVTIDSTPATSNLQLALDFESTVEDIATQLGQQQKVSSPSVSAVIFTDNDVADDPGKLRHAQSWNQSTLKYRRSRDGKASRMFP